MASTRHIRILVAAVVVPAMIFLTSGYLLGAVVVGVLLAAVGVSLVIGSRGHARPSNPKAGEPDGWDDFG